MSGDTKIKSGFDRRMWTTISARPFVGENGSRSTFRQQEDEGHMAFVDQYKPLLFGAIAAVLSIWVVDALINYIY